MRSPLTPTPTMTTTQSIVSVGQAAALLQAMPQRIKAAALEIGVSPALVINGVTHFNECDLERIGEKLRERSGVSKRPPAKRTTTHAVASHANSTRNPGDEKQGHTGATAGPLASQRDFNRS